MKMNTVHSSQPYATEDEQKKISDAMPHAVIVGAGFGRLDRGRKEIRAFQKSGCCAWLVESPVKRGCSSFFCTALQL